MPAKKCRVCGNKFFNEPLAQYKNMPKAAQYLPGSGTLKYDKGIGLILWQCSGCGLVQLGNDPVPYYKEVIRAAAVSREMKEFREKQFSSFIKRFSLKGKKVIEIGCGRGEYLSIMKRAGVKAYGLEGSSRSVKECRKAGLNVTRGFIGSADARLNNKPFDAFFILNYLEHLPDPNSVIQGIRNNLSDSGVGLVEVPNFNMMLRKKLFSEFIPDHLFYFTRETLASTLGLNGFDVIECKEVWHDYIISAVVKKRRKLDLSYFNKHQDKIKRDIESYIKRFKRKRVAVWGAGHQAFAILSLFNVADKIRYVIDSAPFKQGKYTPATHIPIVSPDILKTDPADAIIVMAASYSDEVAKTIHRNYGDKFNIAILRDFGLEVG